LTIGLPVLAPALRDTYHLSLVQVGLALDSVWIGTMLTLLPWGLLADRYGERLVLAGGLGCCGAALVGAAYIGEFASLIVVGAKGGAARASV
jgi:MFS family permease